MASKTCASIGTWSVACFVKDAKLALRRSDYVELRLDFLPPADIPTCLRSLRPYLNRCICTLRPKSEGGKFPGPESERISILKLIADFDPFLIDVEYNTLRLNKDLYRYLKSGRSDTLVSWHDFAKTPSDNTLAGMARRMSKFSTNIKIVTMARTIGDTIRVLGLYKTAPRKTNLVAFAMGDYGRMSRILCTRLGSPFTYVSLGKPVAPGQFSLDEMKSIFRLQKR
ncbi:MAG: type I 3-dehydroquinate dehydratase [Thaumarchaeota archaeon]|nr:type I 3-dehydroquinate dehydratase [Nitrososphaerota archaeon]